MLSVQSSEAEKRSTESPRSVRRVAMDCLARREHSFFELKQKLQVRLPDRDTDEIQRELERLRDENLQSDRRFVESFVRYRKSRGFGYLHIRDDLRRRFVPDTLIGEFLFEDDADWPVLADGLVKRKLNDYTLDYGSKSHCRLVRLLQSRGYSAALIQATLVPYLKQV